MDKQLQITLITREEDRKRGQRDGFRDELRNKSERLRIRNDELRRRAQKRKRRLQLGFAADERRNAVVKQLTQGLLLRQDQPSLWRCLVDRRDEHDRQARPQ